MTVHVAAEIGCRSIIGLFIDQSIREHGRDKDGRSLLHFLVMWQPGYLIEDFINAKSPIIDVLDRKRRTPLAYAARYANNDALEVLLHHGANVDFPDSNGSLHLHQALKESAATASLLIAWDAKLNKNDGFRQSCLQVAIRSQRKDIVELVFSYIADWEYRLDNRGWQLSHESTVGMIHNKDFSGKTALHRVCAAHDFCWEYTSKEAVFTFVRTLIKYGADVNAQNNFGYTPAHVAAIGHNMPAMAALLDEDPDLALLDQHTCTATDWALAQGQIEMAERMREAGGVTTQNYAAKLGAWHGSEPSKGSQKQYDMSLWSVMSPEEVSSLARKRSRERRSRERGSRGRGSVAHERETADK